SACIFHDKEQLLEGRLAVRKIELYRPRLRVLRRRDGSLNLTGILGTPRPDEPIPTIVIREGTVVIEVEGSAQDVQPIVIQDVHLAVLNDSVHVVRFEGGGQSELLGPVRLHGLWQRAAEEFVLSLEAPAVPVGPVLLSRVSACNPDITAQLGRLE